MTEKSFYQKLYDNNEFLKYYYRTYGARHNYYSVIFINICVGLALTALETQNNIFNIIIIIICIYRRYTVEVSSIIEHIII